MATELQITDGTTTVDFVADSDYGLLGWPLKVAPFRRSKLSERTPYAVVQEQVKVFVTGSDAQDAQENLLALIKLLDQSQRVANGDDTVTPVRLVYEPNSDSADTWECMILGNNNAPMVTLPPRYVQSSITQVADNVTLTFLREGLWVKSTSETASSFTSLTSDGLVDISFSGGEPDAYSPLDINVGIDNRPQKGYVFYADDGYAAIGSSAANVTASTTAAAVSITGTTYGSTSTSAKKATMFVKLRNNSSTATFFLYFVNGFANVATQEVIVPAGSSGIQIVSFPPVSTAPTSLYVYSDITDGSESIDIRDIMILYGDVNAFYFDHTFAHNVLTINQIDIDSRILTAATPATLAAARIPVSGGGTGGFYSNKDSGVLGLLGMAESDWNIDLTGSFAGSQSISRYVGSLLPT